MRSLFQKSIVTIGVIAAAVVLAGNAMAAAAHPGKKPVATQTRRTIDVAAIPPYPNYTSAASPVSLNRGGLRAATPPAYRYRAVGYSGAAPAIDVGQLLGSMLGTLPPQYAAIVQNAMRHPSSRGSSGTYDPSWDSPSYDTSAPIDNSAEDAAAAAAANAETQEANDLSALDASIAAAEEQNDEANAATLQTEINAGM